MHKLQHKQHQHVNHRCHKLQSYWTKRKMCTRRKTAGTV